MITLEGPDLSGKTTLYESIHKLSDYKWNIQDRSALSMLVYSRLYGRNDFYHVENLKAELANLNNIMIILLPKWEVIIKRFEKRGDAIQNFVSLKKVYNLFEEATAELKSLPNVIVVNSVTTEDVITSLVSELFKYEQQTLIDASNLFFQAAATDESLEKLGMTLTHYVHDDFAEVNEEMLNYDKEKDYYNQIRNAVLKKLDDELAGKNEYSRKESLSSRRFIYTADTCISLCHFMFRKSILCCDFLIRSSNTKETLKYDLNFLKSLTSDVFSFLNLEDDTLIKMNVKINSAHILNKI